MYLVILNILIFVPPFAMFFFTGENICDNLPFILKILLFNIWKENSKHISEICIYYLNLNNFYDNILQTHTQRILFK